MAMVDNYECGGYVFSANFDSGNLAQVDIANTTQGKYQIVDAFLCRVTRHFGLLAISAVQIDKKLSAIATNAPFGPKQLLSFVGIIFIMISFVRAAVAGWLDCHSPSGIQSVDTT